MPRTHERGLELTDRLDPLAQERTRRAREAFLDGSWDGVGGSHRVRADILQSWRRSRDSGVSATGTVPRVEVPADTTGPLVDAARPVLDHLSKRWRDSTVWGFLLDREGTQILPVSGSRGHVMGSERVGSVPGAQFSENNVGTNGASFAVLLLRPYLVAGHEHYSSAAIPTVSVGLPVRDALKRTQGFLVLCSRVDTAHPMIVPYGVDLANSISERLAAATDPGDRALFEQFMRHAATPSVPVVVFNDRYCALNSAAEQLLGRGQDLDLLRQSVRDSRLQDGTTVLDITIGDDPYRVQCQGIDSGSKRRGVVATLRRTHRAPATPAFESAENGAVETLDRARVQNIGVLVRGEPGSGRAHLVRTSGPLREIHATAAAASPERWLDLLRQVLRTEPAVLIRDLDELPDEGRRLVVSLVRASSAWCAATARPDARDLYDAFPVTVDCSPLRSRKDELPEIVADVLADAGAPQVRCAPEALNVLAQHDWPGNIGELRTVTLNALIARRGDRITLEDLPKTIAVTGQKPAGSAIEQMERELIFEALKNAGWNRDAAADALGISRSTMYRRLRRFPFQIPSSRT